MVSQYYHLNRNCHLLRKGKFKDHTYLLVCTRPEICLEIGVEMASLLKFLKRSRTVNELILLYYKTTGKFEPTHIESLIKYWFKLGIIAENTERKSYYLDSFTWVDKLIFFQIRLPGINNLAQFIYQKFCAPLQRFKLLTPLILILIVSGLWAARQYNTANNPVSVSVPTVLLISLISLYLHELGHAVAMKMVKAPIIDAGIQLFLGLPVMYVDTTTAWIKPKWQRILTASGGVVVNMCIAASAGIGISLTSDPYLQKILLVVVYANLLQLFFNLIPFVSMDGYFILIDLVEEPLLDYKAEKYVWALLKHPQRHKWWHGRQKYYLAFGVASFATTIGFALYAIDFWYSLLA
jgi:Zn-dependent protease